MLEITLTNAELEALMRPVNGEGGWQSFLRRLQGQVQGNVITVSQADLIRSLQYSVCQGGFEDRIRPVAEAAARTLSP